MTNSPKSEDPALHMLPALRRLEAEDEAERLQECTELGLPADASDFDMMMAVRDRVIAKHAPKP